MKKVCAKVKEETGSRKLLCAVDGVIERLNLVLDGWGRYFRNGYPSRQFAKVNHYVRQRLYRFLNRKSQRKYRLRYAETYYGECQRQLIIAVVLVTGANVYLLGANVRDEKFVGPRKIALCLVQYPIEALEGPVLQERAGGG